MNAIRPMQRIVTGIPQTDGAGVRLVRVIGRRDLFPARAGQEGMRFVLFASRPLREPVAWGGPIGMNTPEELPQAFAEIENDTFIRSSGGHA